MFKYELAKDYFGIELDIPLLPPKEFTPEQKEEWRLETRHKKEELYELGKKVKLNDFASRRDAYIAMLAIAETFPHKLRIYKYAYL